MEGEKIIQELMIVRTTQSVAANLVITDICHSIATISQNPEILYTPDYLEKLTNTELEKLRQGFQKQLQEIHTTLHMCLVSHRNNKDKSTFESVINNLFIIEEAMRIYTESVKIKTICKYILIILINRNSFPTV
ncbi:hypothetical protein K2X92_01745 [Candidatus Gracilibacteria bacterium]|nr:hypothetical protein [Candidatus Gracilibacteria bacterium]